MTTVNMREFRTHLSRLIRQVNETGERIAIASRGKHIAWLEPAPSRRHAGAPEPADQRPANNPADEPSSDERRAE